MVKHIDLARHRTFAFATHGLMAGDFKGLAEPALVLAPPDKGSELDDGLITAGAIIDVGRYDDRRIRSHSVAPFSFCFHARYSANRSR